jgi:hypothetical protein
VQGWLHNPHGVLADVHSLRIALRDADDRLLDVLDSSIHQPAAELQFVRVRPDVSPGSIQDARQADLWLDYSYEMDGPLAQLTTEEMQPRLDGNYRMAVAFESAPLESDALRLEADLRVFHGHSYAGFVQVVLELRPKFRVGELDGRVHLLVRDEAGMALGAGADSVSFPTDGSAAVVALTVDLPRNRIRAVRRLELRFTARRSLRVQLGRFALGLG